MVEVGYFSRMVIINRVIRGLCEEGKINEVLSVLVFVCEISKIFSKISYNILIDVFNREGYVFGVFSVYGVVFKLGVILYKRLLSV